jgi:hypothetical protein
MSDNGLLIGTEFNQNMFGFKVDPLDLIIELGKELKDQKKKLNHKKIIKSVT